MHCQTRVWGQKQAQIGAHELLPIRGSQTLDQVMRQSTISLVGLSIKQCSIPPPVVMQMQRPHSARSARSGGLHAHVNVRPSSARSCRSTRSPFEQTSSDYGSFLDSRGVLAAPAPSLRPVSSCSRWRSPQVQALRYFWLTPLRLIAPGTDPVSERLPSGEWSTFRRDAQPQDDWVQGSAGEGHYRTRMHTTNKVYKHVSKCDNRMCFKVPPMVRGRATCGTPPLHTETTLSRPQEIGAAQMAAGGEGPGGWPRGAHEE